MKVSLLLLTNWVLFSTTGDTFPYTESVIETEFIKSELKYVYYATNSRYVL
jgi:hypothetical protein